MMTVRSSLWQTKRDLLSDAVHSALVGSVRLKSELIRGVKVELGEEKDRDEGHGRHHGNNGP